MLFREIIKIGTNTDEFYDITNRIRNIVEQCGIEEGSCHIFIPGTTAGIILNENDRLLIEDFRSFFEKVAAKDKVYSHPSNAQSHLKAFLADCEKTLPISKGKLVLGNWQNIIIWEFDLTPRERDIIVTLTGD